jgi:uncharacterized integral membrane protein
MQRPNTSYRDDASQPLPRISNTVLINKPCIPLVLLFVHFFIIMVVLLVFVWADNEDTSAKYLGGLNFGSKLFNWHPVFMTWATSALIEGALAYRAMRFYSHREKKLVHGIWNFIAVLLFCAGLISVFRYKEKNHLASLYSTHSWLGIFTVVLIFAQFVVGFGVYALPRVTMVTKQRIYPLHSAFGLASTVTAIAAVLSGIDHENTMLGCAYSVVNKDLDPAIHYTDLPRGCRMSNGIAVMMMILLMLFVYVIANLKTTRGALELPKGRVDVPTESERVYFRDAPNAAEDSVSSMVVRDLDGFSDAPAVITDERPQDELSRLLS